MRSSAREQLRPVATKVSVDLFLHGFVDVLFGQVKAVKLKIAQDQGAVDVVSIDAWEVDPVVDRGAVEKSDLHSRRTRGEADKRPADN